MLRLLILLMTALFGRCASSVASDEVRNITDLMSKLQTAECLPCQPGFSDGVGTPQCAAFWATTTLQVADYTGMTSTAVFDGKGCTLYGAHDLYPNATGYQILNISGSNSRVAISNLTFLSGGGGGKGSAVHMSEGPMQSTFTSCNFYYNGGTDGGAVYMQGGPSATFSSCDFRSNKAVGGVMRLEYSLAPVHATIDECSFASNTGKDGRAVVSRGIYATIRHSVFRANDDGSGGGVELMSLGLNGEGPADMTMLGCTFDRNTHSVKGGALLIDESQATVTHCFFSSCEMGPANMYLYYSPGGGAIYATAGNTGACSLVVHSSSFSSCVGQNGGVLFAESNAVVDAQLCRFESNSAPSREAFSSNTHGRSEGFVGGTGGAITLIGAGDRDMGPTNGGPILTAQDCTFTSNVATEQGGAVWAAASHATISHCVFCGNAVDLDPRLRSFEPLKLLGGGAFGCAMNGGTDKAKCHLNATTFENNSAARRGGAVAFDYMNPLVNSYKVNLACPQPPCLEMSGGEGRIWACSFIANTARSAGGAIDATSSQPNVFYFEDVVFRGNRAPLGATLSWTKHGSLTWIPDMDPPSDHIFWHRRIEDGAVVPIPGPMCTSDVMQRSWLGSPPSDHLGNDIYPKEGYGDPMHALGFGFGMCPEACAEGQVASSWTILGTSANSMNITVQCSACPVGRSWSLDPLSGASVCKSCAATEFLSNITQRCTSCTPGHRCDGAIRTACARGRFQGSPAQTMCVDCASGQFGAANATLRCTSCPAGRYATSAGSPECTACPAGRVQPNVGLIGCVSCVNGSDYQDEHGQSSCKACRGCEIGFAVNGSQMCRPDRAGLAHNDKTGDDDGTGATVPSHCLACGQGKFSDTANTDACRGCPAGYAQGSTTSSACNICTAGQFAFPGGASACTVCPSGHMQQTMGESECTVCERGSYATQQSISCIACPLGFVGANAGLAACERCRVGTYASVTKSEVCTSCAPGEFQPRDASDACERCPAGFFRQATGSTSCAACATGTYSKDQGSESCVWCDDKQVEYTAASQATKCKRCAVNAIVKGATCACKNRNDLDLDDPNYSPGYWEVGFVKGTFPRATSSKVDCNSDMGALGCCRPCPVGADCVGGRLYVRPGYWRFGGAKRGTAVIKLCPTPEACPGTAPLDRVQSIWGSNGTSGSNGTRPSSIASGPCLIGHKGRLCGLCLENWRPAARDLCVECGESVDDKTPKVLLGLFGSLALLAVVTCTVTSSDHDERQVDDDGDAGSESKAEEEANNGMYAVGKAAGSVAMVETILPFCQRYSAMDSSYSAFKWPPLMTAVTRWLSVTYGSLADVLRVVGPCSLDMTFPERLAMQTCVVPWMIGIAVAALGLARCARDRMKQQRTKVLEDIRREAAQERRGRAAKAKLKRKVRRAKRPLQYQMTSVVVRLVSLLLFSIRFLYPGISSLILRSFLCIDIEGTQVLEEMVDVVCWSSEYYARVGILAVFGCVVLLFGIPVALGYAVHRERRVWQKMTRAADAEKARVLERLLKTETALDRVKEMGRMKRLEHQHVSAKMMRQVMRRFVRVYKDEYWWWFLLEMIMSLYLIAVLPILPHVGAQVATGGVAALLQVVLPARFQPFAHAEANIVTVVGGCLYYLQYISGLTKLLAESSASSERREHLERADKLIVFVVVLVIFGIVLCLLRTCGGLVLYAARAAETQCGSSKDEKESKAKVVPISQAKTEEESRPNEEEVAYKAMRPSLMAVRPPSWRVLEACPSRLRKEYLEQWQGLVRLHVEVVAVAMQAVTRGFIERRQSKRQREEGISRLSVEEVQAMSTVDAGVGALSGSTMRKQGSIRQKRKAGNEAEIADDRHLGSEHNEAIVETEPFSTHRNAAEPEPGTAGSLTQTDIIDQKSRSKSLALPRPRRNRLKKQASIDKRNDSRRSLTDEHQALLIIHDDLKEHAASQEQLAQAQEASAELGAHKRLLKEIKHKMRKQVLAEVLEATLGLTGNDHIIPFDDAVKLFEAIVGRSLDRDVVKKSLARCDKNGDEMLDLDELRSIVGQKGRVEKRQEELLLLQEVSEEK